MFLQKQAQKIVQTQNNVSNYSTILTLLVTNTWELGYPQNCIIPLKEITKTK